MTEEKLGKEVLVHLSAAAAAYTRYMNGGQKFCFAQEIKSANDTVYSLLVEYEDLVPDSLQPDCRQLLDHIEVWSALWEELAAKMRPQPHDVFVFQNNHNYPRTAADRIRRYFEN